MVTIENLNDINEKKGICEFNYDSPIESAADVQNIVNIQSRYYQSGITRSPDFRIIQLKRLQAYLRLHEDDALDALYKDLGKSRAESYATELGLVLDEINYCLKHIRKWMKPKHVPTPLAHFPTTSTIYPYPFGVVGLFSPWNYPLQLALLPLVDAISAGNCIVMKPSKSSVHTSAFLRKLCKEIFDPRYIFCLQGSSNMDKWLLEVNFDKIMFTGSPKVGKEIMKHAADDLTSITLELGGKSPVFILPDANLKRAGERIAWGKCLNSGQTCVGPDYILAHESVVDEFVDHYYNAVHRYYGQNVLESPDYPHMISEHHFDRVCNLIDNRGQNVTLAMGGNRNRSTLQIEPTVLTGVDLADPIMSEEIFGPALPIIAWKNIEDAIAVTLSYGHPLACYIFTNNRKTQHLLLDFVPSGGAVINDVVIHASSSRLPFGGLQNSGIGAYHGKAGFDSFTHYKSTMKKSTLIDLPFRYPPFDKFKLDLIKLALK